jgi:hypothetical protein
MIIPREGDLVRLYIQLENKDIIDPATGRLKKEGMGPEKLLEVCGECYQSPVHSSFAGSQGVIPSLSYIYEIPCRLVDALSQWVPPNRFCVWPDI